MFADASAGGDDGSDLEAFVYCSRWLDGCRMIDRLGVGLIAFPFLSRDERWGVGGGRW